ncbi:MAG: hypothetical protein L6437_03360 [Kiritimatiellae bacterium]|nr:hypothetical protein [Kiritimatiellia bacterium]
MNYFLRTPRPRLNYACRFANNLAACPPGPRGEDLVAHGDTDVRMESTLPALRALAGIKEGAAVDKGLFNRIMSYIGKNHLSETLYASACAADLPPETKITSIWTTAWTV